MKSYQITFLMLICISLLTGIRSLQDELTTTKRLSLQLSTFVTSIASFHYFYMLQSVERVISYRYFDWLFTTPLLLIDLVILLFEKLPTLVFMIEIILYNTCMLGIGYLGEIGTLSMLNSMWIGFIPFILMFYRIYQRKVDIQNKDTNMESNNNTRSNTTLSSTFNTTQLGIFITFILLWGSYGITHNIKHKTNRQTIYNILDLITKGFFGLFIYYNSW